MPYNPALHANLNYVSKYHKELLDKLCVSHKRKIKDELEALIEQAAMKEGVK